MIRPFRRILARLRLRRHRRAVRHLATIADLWRERHGIELGPTTPAEFDRAYRWARWKLGPGVQGEVLARAVADRVACYRRWR